MGSNAASSNPNKSPDVASGLWRSAVSPPRFQCHSRDTSPLLLLLRWRRSSKTGAQTCPLLILSAPRQLGGVFQPRVGCLGSFTAAPGIDLLAPCTSLANVRPPNQADRPRSRRSAHSHRDGQIFARREGWQGAVEKAKGPGVKAPYASGRLDQSGKGHGTKVHIRQQPCAPMLHNGEESGLHLPTWG